MAKTLNLPYVLKGNLLSTTLVREQILFKKLFRNDKKNETTNEIVFAQLICHTTILQTSTAIF